MRVRELDKALNVACRHSIAGCREYDARPASCRTFRCVGLQTRDTAALLAPELRPDRSRVVMRTADAGETARRTGAMRGGRVRWANGWRACCAIA